MVPVGDDSFPSRQRERLTSTTAAIDENQVSLLLKILHGAKLNVWAADNAENDYAIRLWNSTAERFYGFTREEAMGSNYLNLFVNPAGRGQAMADHELIIHGGKGFGWDFAADDIAKDGTARTILVNAFRVWDDAFQRFIMAEVSIDISGFGRLSQQLRQVRGLSLLQCDAPHQFAMLRGLKMIDEVVATLTRPDGGGLEDVVRVIGEALRIMLPGRPGEPICRVWLVDDGQTKRLAVGSDELQSPPRVRETDLIERVLQQHAQVVAHCSPSDESQLINTDAGNMYRSVVATPLLFGAEVLGVVLAYFRDACNQTTDHDLLSHFSSHAAVAIVMARTAAELQRRRREETERVKHAIIQSVLHTVGNEAGRVKLAADFLAHELEGGRLLNDTSREALDHIKLAADRLGQIMTELVQRGGQATQPVELELAEAVRVVTRGVERDYYDTIYITHDIDSALTVCVSEYLFREAFSNLIHNAVQAMTEADGGGDLRVSAKRIDHAQRDQYQAAIYLDVEDSGPGILPEYRERIWEHGFTTRGEGRGCGLFHTRGLMRMLGGSVELLDRASELGGAHFRMILPILACPE